MTCPIARGLERVGEWWSILILRDVLGGIRRFDALQENLGIAPGMLTRRLNALVKDGLLTRRRYQTRPPRYEYAPTQKAEDFAEVLVALTVWGSRHFAPEGPSVLIADRKTGNIADPVMVDRKTGRRLTRDDYIYVSARTRKPLRASSPRPR
ncbi:MAG TPA: helix-turn-helix domain-containing protein [Rhizomicrobium sp.]|nr:helix-turn-helix domain-containing protein [Rhizomicrobium sp.]